MTDTMTSQNIVLSSWDTLYTLFAFCFLTQLIADWRLPWINSATTSWPSKEAHILSVQEHASEVSEWATIYLEIASFEACNLSQWYIIQFVSQETHRISITKPNQFNIFILGNVRKNINSACEQKISLVVQEKVHTDDIVLLWVKMATLSGNVP
jgi:hypothetical protein